MPTLKWNGRKSQDLSESLRGATEQSRGDQWLVMGPGPDRRCVSVKHNKTLATDIMPFCYS